MSDATTARSHALGGVLLIVFTLLSWASVPLFLRHFTTAYHLDPFSANGWRYGISAAFWLPFLFYAWSRGKLPPALLKAALLPTAFNILGQTTFAWGPALLEPGFFSFVFRVQIIFVTLGAYMLFPGERATLKRPMYWVGIALVVIGSVGLVLLKEPAKNAVVLSAAASASASSTHTIGVIVALISGVLFAGYGLSVRYAVNQYSPVISFGVICQYTAVGALATMCTAPLFASWMPAAMQPDPLLPVRSFGAGAWGLLIASAFIGIAISHVSYYESMRRLGVSVSVGIIQLQPIFAAIGSFWLFDEKLSGLQWASGIVGIVGAVLMLWSGQVKIPAAAEEAS